MLYITRVMLNQFKIHFCRGKQPADPIMQFPGDPHPLFFSAYFRERCADQLPDGMSPLEFYLSSTRAMAIDPHPWFSASYYLRSNPDVVKSGMNPLLHFVRSGVSEGRRPHPEFTLRGYWQRHTDPTSTYVAREGSRHIPPADTDR